MAARIRLGTGFNTSFKVLHTWFGQFLVMGFLYLAILGIAKSFWALLPFSLPLMFAMLFVLKPGFDCGLTYAALRAHDEAGPVQVGDLFRGFDYLSSAVPAAIVVALFQAAAALPGGAMVAGGIVVLAVEGPTAVGVLLIVLGSVVLLAGIIVVSTFYVFVPQTIVDTKADFWACMEASRKLVFAEFWGALGTLILSVLMEIVGFLFCCVGIFYTLPLRFAFVTSVYRTGVAKAMPARPRGRETGRRTRP
ncbi:MAG: hypothetical protein QHJ34_02430 [bacterium]|jgi:hypothetical protein|nr:hypothetical protein [candidate division KSB1 bacterium]MDH7559075.1 hypothetical protein [bacterium]